MSKKQENKTEQTSSCSLRAKQVLQRKDLRSCDIDYLALKEGFFSFFLLSAIIPD